LMEIKKIAWESAILIIKIAMIFLSC